MVLYPPGDFSFISDQTDREILTHDYKSLVSIEGSCNFKKSESMEFIATYGWTKYVLRELNKKVYYQIFKHLTEFNDDGSPKIEP